MSLILEQVEVYRWSRWSDWSKCSASCGKGHNYRERRCTSDVRRNRVICRGLTFENRTCHSESCASKINYCCLFIGLYDRC